MLMFRYCFCTTETVWSCGECHTNYTGEAGAEEINGINIQQVCIVASFSLRNLRISEYGPGLQWARNSQIWLLEKQCIKTFSRNLIRHWTFPRSLLNILQTTNLYESTLIGCLQRSHFYWIRKPSHDKRLWQQIPAKIHQRNGLKKTLFLEINGSTIFNFDQINNLNAHQKGAASGWQFSETHSSSHSGWRVKS